MSTLINPDEAFKAFVQQETKYKAEVQANKLAWISAKHALEEAAKNYQESKGSLAQAQSALKQATSLVESVNTSWDTKIQGYEDTIKRRAQQNFDNVTDAQEEFFKKGYLDAKKELKEKYTLTKKKDSKKPVKKKKSKPVPIQEAIIKSRAKKDLDIG